MVPSVEITIKLYLFARKSERKGCVGCSLHLNIYLSACFMSVLFQNSDDKRSVLNRISNFFNSRRKKSNSRQHSDSDTSAPTSPLSPHSHKFQQEDGLKTPTSSRRDCELALPHYAQSRTGAKYGESFSQCSSPSSSSQVSLPSSEAELPFADSDSSGRSSVRQVHVCRVSTASSERNSGNVTPTTLNLALPPHPGSCSKQDFAESLVQEVSKRLEARMEERSLTNAKGFSQDNAVSKTTTSTLKIPLSKSIDAPKSPNLTSISVSSNKTSVKVGGRGHTTALREVTLASKSPSSQLSMTQQESKDSDISTENSGSKRRARVFSWEELPPANKTHIPRDDSPVQLHKAIWVETHLGDWEQGEREGDKEEDVTKELEEGFRADSPPVLAIPATVIPEDDLVNRSTADSPLTPSESLPSRDGSPQTAISLAPTAGEFQNSPLPEEPDTGWHSKQSSLPQKRKSKELRVTRKTVNLPSKHRFFAKKVYIEPESNLDGNESTREDYNGDITSRTVDTAEVKL